MKPGIYETVAHFIYCSCTKCSRRKTLRRSWVLNILVNDDHEERIYNFIVGVI